jgi:hypothetical protein
MATTLAAQLCLAYLTLDAIHEENGLQLLTSTSFTVLSGLLWLIFAVGAAEQKKAAVAAGSCSHQQHLDLKNNSRPIKPLCTYHYPAATCNHARIVAVSSTAASCKHCLLSCRLCWSHYPLLGAWVWHAASLQPHC